MKYKLKITRTLTDVGFIEIEADSAEDAKRKYFYPTHDERIIFDDEIDWHDGDEDYEAEVMK